MAWGSRREGEEEGRVSRERTMKEERKERMARVGERQRGKGKKKRKKRKILINLESLLKLYLITLLQA